MKLLTRRFIVSRFHHLHVTTAVKLHSISISDFAVSRFSLSMINRGGKRVAICQSAQFQFLYRLPLETFFAASGVICCMTWQLSFVQVGSWFGILGDSMEALFAFQTETGPVYEHLKRNCSLSSLEAPLPIHFDRRCLGRWFRGKFKVEISLRKL